MRLLSHQIQQAIQQQEAKQVSTMKNNRSYQDGMLYEENVRVPEVLHNATGDKTYKLNKDFECRTT